MIRLYFVRGFVLAYAEVSLVRPDFIDYRVLVIVNRDFSTLSPNHLSKTAQHTLYSFQSKKISWIDMEEIPSEAFEEILKELHRRPVPMNHERLRSGGNGRSTAFGIVVRRSMPPDYCRNCWKRPFLYKLLLDFANRYVHIPFNAITVNQNYKALPHYDKNNVGDSFLVAFGDYTGGNLIFHEGEKKGSYDIRHKPIVDNFSKVLHSVDSFEGERFSLVFYQYNDPRWTFSVPPPSVVNIDGEWLFKRGDVIIKPKEGLPHPLRGRKKGLPAPQTTAQNE